jgi:thioredoxin-like negative regulator of GroEL
VTLNDVHVPSLLQLASALAAQSRFPDALPFAVKAASLEPRTVGARLTLARVLWGNGRRDDALANGRAAQALARSDQERNAARQLLEYFAKLAAAR